MRKKYIIVTLLIIFISRSAFAQEAVMQAQIDELKMQLGELSSHYERKIDRLEARLVLLEGGYPKEHLDQEPEEDAHEDPSHHHIHGILGDKVSVVGAMDGRFVNAEGSKNMLFMHEAKIGAQAQITDWLFGYLTLTKHHSEDVHIEEAYAILTFDELNLSVKPGKFFVDFGPENLAHFFDRRTITLSAMHEGMFGAEPWSDTGLQVNWKIPVDFYSNISVAVVTGDNASSFGDGVNEISNNNLPVSMHWTNAFTGDWGHLRTGNSFAWGQWDRDDTYNTALVGVDAYYKLGNFDAQAEFIYRWKELPGVKEPNAYGYYTWGAYTIPMDYKYLKGIEFLVGFGQYLPDTTDRETRVTPQVSLFFNEFAKLRATYEVRDQYPKDNKDNRFITQFALAF